MVILMEVMDILMEVIKKKDEDKESLLRRDSAPSQNVKTTPTKDLNMSAVFKHYLGDCVASGCLLAAGLLAHFFPHLPWVVYLDPIASLLIAAMLVWSAVPLIKECCEILLQQTPDEIQLSSIRNKMYQVKGLQGVHDLHVWELADGLAISTLHATVLDTDVNQSEDIKEDIKKILHRYGIHSSTIQMEVITADNDNDPNVCKHNCKVGCKEDWCCKGEKETRAIDLPPSTTIELQ